MMKTHNNPVPHSPALTGGKRQHLLRKALGLLALSAAAFWGTACSSDELDALSGAGSGGAASRVPSYVSLRIATPSATPAVKRDSPTGGEDGDGRETGQTNENSISTVTAFFFPEGVDINNTAATTTRASAVVHFDGGIKEVTTGTTAGIDKVYQTDVVSVDLDPATYEILIVANGGEDMEGIANTTPTIGNLRDYIRGDALWTASDEKNLSTYTDFVMASAATAEITIGEENNDVRNPATASVSVERLAARVDYNPNGPFTLTKGQEGANYSGKITITGLALVNDLSLGEYYFKRVTVGSDVTGNVTYLGDESTLSATASGAIPGGNFVLDPWTIDKNETNASTGAPFRLGGHGYPVDGLYPEGHYFPDDCSKNAAYWSAEARQGLPLEDGDFYIAGYVHENTLCTNSPLENYATAAVFKAVFAPSGLNGYQQGYTFFDYGGTLYVDLEDLMNTYHGADFVASQTSIESATTWAEVRTAANSLTANDPTGYREWLLLQIPADDSGTPTFAELTWEYYMLHEVGYSKTANAGAVTDQNGKVTQDELINYGVRTFYDSECYYTWFLKHAEDGDDDAIGIMEYGVVRNNIYKLSVTGVRDLGGMVPEEDNKLRVSVYVNDWQLLDRETIHM